MRNAPWIRALMVDILNSVSDGNLHIDERTHKTVPSVKKRMTNALVSILLGFLLVQIFGFWMFPGIGWHGLNAISSHPFTSFINQIANVYILAFLAICAVMGWFRGQYFIYRLKGYLDYWKFW